VLVAWFAAGEARTRMPGRRRTGPALPGADDGQATHGSDVPMAREPAGSLRSALDSEMGDQYAKFQKYSH
jgi:hypothetical protein